MKALLNRLEGGDIILIILCLGTTLTAAIAAWRAPHEYTACREMAHGNIQAYNECVRAEHGNR